MGLSRDTFYSYQTAVENGGIEALLDKNRRQPNIKNRVDELTEEAVIKMAFDFSAFGQLRASNELRKNGIFISPSGVFLTQIICTWAHNNDFINMLSEQEKILFG